MKRVPDIWWDLEGDSIIVESDDKRFPVIKKWECKGDWGPIVEDEVEPYIKDINEGRLSFYEEAKKYEREYNPA